MDGVAVIIIAWFLSHEVNREVPALLCFASLQEWQTVIYCFLEPYMTVVVNDEKVLLPLEATKSGHLALPIDNWPDKDGQARAEASTLAFHNKQDHVDAFYEDPFPYFEQNKTEESPLCTLEEFLQTDEKDVHVLEAPGEEEKEPQPEVHRTPG